jgi:hypothetical protein
LQDYGLKMTLAADALLLGHLTYKGVGTSLAHQGR